MTRKQQVPLPPLWQTNSSPHLPCPLLLADLSAGVMLGLPKLGAVVHGFGRSVLKLDTNVGCPRW